MTKAQDPDSRARRSADQTKAAHDAARDEMAKRNERVSQEGRARRRAEELERARRRQEFNR